MMSKTNAIFCALAILLIACSGSDTTEKLIRPKYVIPEDSLILILKDIHTVDAAAKQNFIPNNANNYQKYREFKFVLEKYHVDFQRFDSTLSYYANHSLQFEKMYDRIVQEMKEGTQQTNRPPSTFLRK